MNFVFVAELRVYNVVFDYHKYDVTRTKIVIELVAFFLV